jgi:hypothetical protein
VSVSTSILAAALLCLTLAACTGGGSQGPSEAPSSGPSPSPAQPSPSGALVPAGLVDAILADLEARIGVDVSSAVVVSAEEATWPDGAMGCPKPGEVYTQAIVDGYRVIVSFDSLEYDYRVSDTGAVRFCSVSG